MIPWIRRRLIENIDRFPIERQPLALEAQKRKPRRLLVAVVVVVVDEEQSDAAGRVPERALERDVLQLGRLGEVDRLRRRDFGRRVEVEVVVVQEQKHSPGRACRGRGTQEKGVELDLGCEPILVGFESLVREVWG